MAGEFTENNDVLVLTDDEGNMYAVPRHIVEAHRLSSEQKSAVESEIGDDVSGFQMQSIYMTEKLAGFYQSERLAEASRERMIREAGSGVGDNSPGHSLSGSIVGVWKSFSFLKPTGPTGSGTLYWSTSPVRNN